MPRTMSPDKQYFNGIRENDCLYIGKTDFLREWWKAGDSATLITRSRGFGKTLMPSTGERFFSLSMVNVNPATMEAVREPIASHIIELYDMFRHKLSYFGLYETERGQVCSAPWNARFIEEEVFASMDEYGFTTVSA